MRKLILQIFYRQSSFYLALLCFISLPSAAQKNNVSIDSIKAWQANYVATHEVVKKKEKKYFRFFPADTAYVLNCDLEKLTDSVGIIMKTSANTLQYYLRYGILHFNLSGKPCQLVVYQSKDLMKTEKYKDYLFVPFTDLTSGDSSYGGGRYLDLSVTDVHGHSIWVDLNKAYNPYCAYATGFHFVIVNGQITAENGSHTGVRNGMVLKGPGAY